MADAALTTELQLKTAGTVEAVSQFNQVAAASRQIGHTAGTSSEQFTHLTHALGHMGGASREVRVLISGLEQALQSVGTKGFGSALAGTTAMTGAIVLMGQAFKLAEESVKDVNDRLEEHGYKKMSFLQWAGFGLGVLDPADVLKEDPKKMAKLRAEGDRDLIQKTMASLEPETLGDWAEKRVKEYFAQHQVRIPAELLLEGLEKRKKEIEEEKFVIKLQTQIDEASWKGARDRIAELTLGQERFMRGLGLSTTDTRENYERGRSAFDRALDEAQGKPKSPLEQTKEFFEQNRKMPEPWEIREAQRAARERFDKWNAQFPVIGLEEGTGRTLQAFPPGVNPESFRRMFAEQEMAKLFPQTSAADIKNKFEEFQNAERDRQIDLADRRGRPDFLNEYIKSLKASGAWTDQGRFGATEEERIASAEGDIRAMERDAEKQDRLRQRTADAYRRDLESPLLTGADARGSQEEYSARIKSQLSNDPAFRGEAERQIKAAEDTALNTKEMRDAIARLAGAGQVAVITIGNN